jgi:hypothetical protein
VISYIVASHDRDVLESNLLASVHLQDGDELIVVEAAPSIAVAYNQGVADAGNDVRCYIHHDVQILDPQVLRAVLLRHCTPAIGMVGVIGSRTPVLPWWEGDTLGAVVDARMGLLDFGPGGECAYLDGLLLATAQNVEWDESYPGFHLYDHDVCEQMRRRGLANLCLTDGHELVRHNTAGPGDTALLDGWDEGVARFWRKWGNRAA